MGVIHVKKKISIGIYIGNDDIDIAAWFNLLKKNNLSSVKWISGICIAYFFNKPIDIGTVVFPNIVTSCCHINKNSSNILFGVGNTQINYKAENKKYSYGWHIKDENGFYIPGSVIAVTIYQQNIIDIIYKICHDQKISTILKVLIRKYLKVGDTEQSPDTNILQTIFNQFMLQSIIINNSTPVLKKQHSKSENSKLTVPNKNPLLDYI